MGALAELVRVQPEARRSGHPQTSLAALGRHATRIAATHPLTPRLGLGTPLSQLRDLDASVLFIGVGFARNTSFHLAEYETDYPGRSWGPRSIPVAGENGRVVWRCCTDLRFHEADFDAMGQAFLDEARSVRVGAMGGARAICFSMAELVTFAGRWMAAHRDLRPAAGSSNA
jgi:aminoglycoside 3-N-acetyltransferase